MANLHPATSLVLGHFDYAHLPEPLQKVSKPFHTLAHELVDKLGDGPESTVGLRKLLEAKDCFVRHAVSQRLEGKIE